MFPDFLEAFSAYSDYYTDNTDPEIKKIFIKVLKDALHEKATKYVDNTGEIKGEARSILEKALQLLHKNKGIHLRFDLNSDKCKMSCLQAAWSLTPILNLQLEVKEGLNKDYVKASINQDVFTANWCPEDDKAGISNRINDLDTITYRGVRLAYILHQTIKNI